MMHAGDVHTVVPWWQQAVTDPCVTLLD